MAAAEIRQIVAERKREPRTIEGRDPLTAERLKEVLHYDPSTGVFYNRYTRHSLAKVGMQAGTIEKRARYSIIAIDGLNYSAHRLAWLYTHGKWPAGNIDHINGEPSDNRIENLRDCSQSDNAFNRHRGPITPSERRGVRFISNGWEASIKKNDRSINLGRFCTFEEAAAARQGAERCLFEAIPEVSPKPTLSLPSFNFVTKKPPKALLTAEALRAVVSYDPETGKFRRLPRSGLAGNVAGQEPYMAVLKDGHLRFKVHSASYLAHRLAWLYMTGEWPQGTIDHVNRDPQDNRWTNLRDVSRGENNRNRRRWTLKVA